MCLVHTNFDIERKHKDLTAASQDAAIRHKNGVGRVKVAGSNEIILAYYCSNEKCVNAYDRKQTFDAFIKTVLLALTMLLGLWLINLMVSTPHIELPSI